MASCISFPFVMTYESVGVPQILVRHIVLPIVFAPTISNMAVDVRRLSHIISGCLCKFIIAVDLPHNFNHLKTIHSQLKDLSYLPIWLSDF